MIAADRRHDLARQLATAWEEAAIVTAPTIQEPALDLADAYLIQQEIIDARLAAGRRRAGWKLGLTTAEPAVTPIVGTLLDDMISPSGRTLLLRNLVGPSVEAELVVAIGQTIDGQTTLEGLLAGPHLVGPGIEVIDYRTRDSSGAIDWVADNSTAAHAIVGDLVPIASIVLPAVEARLSTGGKPLATGHGGKVMGNPLSAVAWLSGHLASRGHRLEEGDVILTGSLTGHHRVPPGTASEFLADFGHLGAVTVHFEP